VPIELSVSFSAHEISVLDVVTARVVVRNLDPLPAGLPGMNDRTQALTFEVRDRATSALVRRMNGFSYQALLMRSRLDATPDLDAVPGGQYTDFTLDLGQFQRTFAAGDYELRATYDYPPAGASAATPWVPLRVVDTPVTRAEAVRYNPVLDGLTLLFEDGSGTTWARLHNYRRPLASWYGQRLELPPGTTGAFCATAGFFQTDSFDPFFETWVVFPHGEYVVARRFVRGVPTGEQRAAPAPPGALLCRSAFYNLAGELFVFFQWDGLLHGYRLDAAALVKVFERTLPTGTPEVCVRADEEFVHIVYPHRGLVHVKVGITGQGATEDQIHRTGLSPLLWTHEPAGQRLKAAFVDSADGRVVEMVIAGTQGVHVERRVLPTRGRITELAFDRGQRGDTHVLYSTSRGKLYLSIGDRGPALIASGQERYFPFVIADSPAYLGYARHGYGWRFDGYTLRRHLLRRIDYDLAPWDQP
jgi:hypothetical protein